MARFRWQGDGEAEKQIRKLGRPVIKRIVEAGADAAVDRMKQRISMMHRATGDMAEGVKKSNYIETVGGGSQDVYPQGEDRKGVRNATKAYVINYGRGGTRHRGKMGDKFITGDSAADEIIQRAMQAESDRILSEIAGS